LDEAVDVVEAFGEEAEGAVGEDVLVDV